MKKLLAPKRRRHQTDSTGSKLRKLREQRGLSMRDVQQESLKLCVQFKDRRFEIGLSRLHLIERGLHIPNIFRAHSMATIYRLSLAQIMAIYGIRSSASVLSRSGKLSVLKNRVQSAA